MGVRIVVETNVVHVGWPVNVRRANHRKNRQNRNQTIDNTPLAWLKE